MSWWVRTTVACEVSEKWGIDGQVGWLAEWTFHYAEGSCFWLPGRQRLAPRP